MAELTYNWKIYNKEEAIKGALVGIEKSNKNDISWTGRLQKTSISNIYTLSFQGWTLQVVGDGYITACSPDPPTGAEWIGYKLMMPFTVMGNTAAVGNSFTRAGDTSAGEPDEVEVDLSVMEPRDYFAVHAMSVMIGQIKHPETLGDSECLFYAKSAYRWAQAMIIAAIDARSEKEEDDPEPQPGKGGVATNILLNNVSGEDIYITGHMYVAVWTASKDDWGPLNIDLDPVSTGNALYKIPAGRKALIPYSDLTYYIQSKKAGEVPKKYFGGEFAPDIYWRAYSYTDNPDPFAVVSVPGSPIFTEDSTIVFHLTGIDTSQGTIKPATNPIVLDTGEADPYPNNE